ncbi:MAG: DNA cytosine methyltransferase [Microbacterium sp.]|jgi:DNA (cytosine-5)-methyltransferase 1|nr:DNA cytosine methyltransferase [Microbacterium sp.]
MTEQLRVGSLFSGIGGLDMAVEAFFGAKTAWQCEFDPEPSKVLAARWPDAPNFGDVTKVKWTPDCPVCGEPTALYWSDQAARAADEREYHCPVDGWFPLSIRLSDPDAARIPEPVEIMCGGFPCQDLSLAGRRAGMRPGTRSGLWADFLRGIAALRPSVVVIENVKGLLSGCAESEADSEMGQCPRCADPDSGVGHAPNVRALGRVLGDLANLGFDAEWHGLLASDVGAPHGRFRVFVLAYARGLRLDARWSTVTREAPSGWASALVGGRADAPVGRRLLRTPLTTSADGVQELERRLPGGRGSGLLPTPSASNTNDGEDPASWLARRDRVKATGVNGNGMGMPLAIAVQLLPTPTTTDAGSNSPGDQARRSPGLRTLPKLLPTPTARDEAGSGGSNASNVTLTDAVVRTDFGRQPNARLLPTPRAARGASGTETMYRLGAERDDTGDRQGNVVGMVEWGEYAPAIHLWESLTRPAPAPTLPDGKNGRHRLAAVFPEWMMGYPAGHVTDILARNPAIKACGNGVVPQQCIAALDILWDRASEFIGSVVAA